MTRSALLLIVGVSGVATSAPVAAQTRWRLVEYEVAFEIHNAGLPVRGSFEDLAAEVHFDPDDPSSASITGRLDPASIRTGIVLRDRHLAGRQFFDVRRFPVIEMRAVSIEAAGSDGAYRGRFEIAIRDVTKVVDVPFRFVRDGDRANVSGTVVIDRVEFGVGDGGFLLGDEVTVTVELTLEPASEGGVAGPG